MNKRANNPRRVLGKVLAAALVAGASALVAVPAAPAQATPVTEWGYAFLDKPMPPPLYHLPAAWEASSSGGGAKLTAHPGAGTYQITFYRIGTPPGAGFGVVHVTAAPDDNAPVWCQAGSWFPQNGNEVINVVCYEAPKAVRVNTDFSVTFGWNTPGSVACVLRVPGIQRSVGNKHPIRLRRRDHHLDAGTPWPVDRHHAWSRRDRTVPGRDPGHHGDRPARALQAVDLANNRHPAGH